MKSEFYQVNSYYQGLLQNYYGGANGCFVAFMHFFYQYNQSVVFQPELSECFEKLWQLELENCTILSEIILKMDGDNKYFSSSKKFLSGYNVDYIKNFSKIFLADIEFLEVNVIEIKNLINKIDNIKIKENLKKILKNKQFSLNFLKEKYFKLNLIG